MINTFNKMAGQSTAIMGSYEKVIWRFFVTFPAFLSVGASQAPVWIIVIAFSIFFSKKLRHTHFIFILAIISIFLIENLIDGDVSSTSIYRLQIVISLLISFFFVKSYDIKDIMAVLRTAVYVNLVLAGLEIILPQICDYMHLLNRVRSCVDGRPSGAYSEPSHIAFLILLAGYVSLKTCTEGRIFQLALIALGLLTISGTLIVGGVSLIAYKFVPLSKVWRFLTISAILIGGNLFYLELRLSEKMPMQQSFDKRSSYTTMFIVAPRLEPTFKARDTNEEFYKDFRYERIMHNNEEIQDGYASAKAASLSIFGTLFFVLGMPLTITLLIILILTGRNINNAGLMLLFWFGLPAALPILPLVFSLLRKHDGQST
jgi:hypothetical protein